jgi:hypothetical protein
MKSWIIGALIAVVVIILLMRTKSFADAMNPPSPAPSPTLEGPSPGQKYYFVAAPEIACPPGYFKPNESEKPKICQLNNS